MPLTASPLSNWLSLMPHTPPASSYQCKRKKCTDLQEQVGPAQDCFIVLLAKGTTPSAGAGSSSQGFVVCLPTHVLQNRREDQLSTTWLPALPQVRQVQRGHH